MVPAGTLDFGASEIDEGAAIRDSGERILAGAAPFPLERAVERREYPGDDGEVAEPDGGVPVRHQLMRWDRRVACIDGVGDQHSERAHERQP